MAGGPPYSVKSPTQPPAQFLSYSPNNKSRPFYNNDKYQQPPQTPPPYSHPPSTLPQSPRFGPPSPLTTNLPPINGAGLSPTNASSQYSTNAVSPQYQGQRPYQGQYAPPPPPPTFANSPPSHAHPLNRHDNILNSPTRESEAYMAVRRGSDGYPGQAAPRPESRPSSQEKPNAMSLSNILGPASNPAPKAASPAPPKTLTKSSEAPVFVAPPPPPSANKVEKFKINGEKRRHSSDHSPVPKQRTPKSEPNGVKQEKPSTPVTAPKPRRALNEKENKKVKEAGFAIDNMDHSDIDDDTFESMKEVWHQETRKRAREIEQNEFVQKKRRQTDLLTHMHSRFSVRAVAAHERHRRLHESSALEQVREKEIQDEKERKKDMQRKRRRENTIRQETQKKKEAEEKAMRVEDAAEKDKLLREVTKAEKKIKQTKRALDRGNAPEEISEVTPLAPNLEGGTTSQFHIGTTDSPEPPKKKYKRDGGPTTRPKKSKEKKQAEIERAQAASAAQDRDELIRIAPKEDPRKEAIKKESKGARSKEPSPAVFHVSSYDTKGYQQIYEQIWRDMARKDVPKVFRIKVTSLATKQENLRKTAQLASKQARKWQERTNKSMKDTQARAKRTMREMMSFWKRNEREERDLRRMAERKELEDAKKAEADRESNRQKRKLNFLISQTELYSHFIGRKIKTDEVERATDDPGVVASGTKIQDGKPGAHTVTLPDSVADLKTKVTNFEDLDFDAEDETVLKEAAMANAQNAIQQAQDKARAFNENNAQAFDDADADLNFQNPTSLGDVQVAQPKMLQAQLKEYQLKGLNWLVNLYEQGINGILADEMGLGKTVQSISVMGYLAEAHNIWGPFLVIAPSSTLHNWQQEVARFVPNIKVLPYWGTAKDRKVLRKFWDRKHITYTKDSEFHVLVTSYQLVVQDAQYFQKIRWQYMILDEAQAIKSSQSSRWKTLLGFHCRNRLLLTGTPIQNNMQELWALLHFIMPTLFDSHDEFSDWFSKDIESHAQSNTKLNQDQLKRLHMILKPFMLRRVKAHVQKELGDKIEEDVFCDLTYRQRAYYGNLRSRISLMDLIEKVAVGEGGDDATLMNLVMQFRKVCNHPDLFERADTASPFSLSYFAETASFMREGQNVNVGYSVRNVIEYDLPRMLCNSEGRIDIAGPNNVKAGFQEKYLGHLMNIWTPENIKQSTKADEAFSFLRFANTSVGEASTASRQNLFERAVSLKGKNNLLASCNVAYEDEDNTTFTPSHALFNIVERNDRKALADITNEGRLKNLLNISRNVLEGEGVNALEPAARPGATAPPIQISCSDQNSITERQNTIFNIPMRKALFPIPSQMEEALLERDIDPALYPVTGMLPAAGSEKARYTNISVPSMRRFVTDSGKLAKLDQLLHKLKSEGHRVLLYFQMTRMIDLMEEYLTYRNYKYCRLDGSTKLEDRRDTVADFQTRPDIFIFLLSTRAGGLGINLTSADTVIFYDSDWNPTIDSQAMDRAHRLGQTKQVTVYRMITRGTIEERIRKRALQKEEVQRVVISGGAGGGVDFNTRNRADKARDMAMWLADDDQAAILEQKEKEAAEKVEEPGPKKRGKKAPGGKKRRGEMSLDEMYHEGEGHFEDANSNKPSGAATPIETPEVPTKGGKKGPRGGKGISKKAKTVKERLKVIDAEGDFGMGGT